LKRKKSDIFIDAILYSILVLLAVITLYPFMNTLAISLNEANDTARGSIHILPRAFTLANYSMVFKNDALYRAYAITIARTLIGAPLGVLATGIFAYGMSKRHLKGRKVYMFMCVLTMYFNGGLIPTYVLFQNLRLVNSFLVYIIPNLINVFYMVILMTYYATIPAAVEESLKIDGAGDFTIFFKLILPLSTPVIATVALFNGVFHWNSWFDAAIYVQKSDLKPVQSVLMSVINQTKFQEAIMKSGNVGMEYLRMSVVNARSITAATMIITIIPIIMIYPFLQRYFIKGIMVGSVKG